MNNPDPIKEAVTVSLSDLKTSPREASIPFSLLEEAFGPSSLGILLVKDLPPNFPNLRQTLLSYASNLANLPPSDLDALTSPTAKYLTGWSHGKEALKTGQYDTHKGSYYVNCTFYQPPTPASPSTSPSEPPSPPPSSFPEYTLPNLWPPESLLPGFQETLQDLCTLIIDVASLVARACDRYAIAHVEDYKPGYLEHVVKTSTTTKARLLHYFPPDPSPSSDSSSVHSSTTDDSASSNDTWCATHLDHGCLTGLTAPLYILEAPSPSSYSQSPHSLPAITDPPDPLSGLYIHSRTSQIHKIHIPPNHLAFQTGETLQLITRGKFRAVPHFVRGPRLGYAGGPEGEKVSRNTLAVFTQPNLGEVVDWTEERTGITFGEFARGVVGRFGVADGVKGDKGEG
ncbi:hypothetical protein MMC12_001569 [Toensbergia leucococca]|nr:hypothetical protein [Toensbergia leucococca]